MIQYTAFDQKHPLKARFSRGWKDATAQVSKSFIIMMCILLLMFVPVILIVASSFLVLMFHFGGAASTSPFVALPGLMILLFVPSMLLYGILRNGNRSLQIEQFCKDNNFEFRSFQASTNKTGSLFTRGDSRKITNEISGTTSHNGFCIYDYQYSTGSGKNRRTYHFGVAEITLKRKFPHILVDSKRDGSISGFEFDASQKLELEGDFNKYFSVYGPKEYEIEVLQVLSPSVMAALLDLRESFDIEIIGDKMFIYNRGTSAKKHTFQAIFSAIEQLSTSTKSVQTTFTMPEQIGDYKPILKRSIWPAVISGAFLLLYVIIRLYEIFS